MEKKKRKYVKIRRSTSVVLMLLLIFFILVLNIDCFTYVFNMDSYDKTRALVMEETTDEFFMLVPMVKLKYRYDSLEHEEKKFFVLEPLFNVSGNKGDHVDIYVNQNAPENVIIAKSFYVNFINWILCALLAIVVYGLVRNIVEKRKEKRTKGEADGK